MGSLNKKLVLGWYGSCSSCEDFSFYNSDGSLKSEMLGVISVVQSAGNYYISWTKNTDDLQRESWLMQSLEYTQNVLKLNHIQDGQDLTEFKCGHLYLITRDDQASDSQDIEHFFDANATAGDKGRAIECPIVPDCICVEA